MPAAPQAHLAVEGVVDEAVMRRLCSLAGLAVVAVRGLQGKAHLLERLPRYNQAARFGLWVVTLDLDQDATCAPEWVPRLLPQPAPGMVLRVAVRAVESWLLADGEHLASFLGISPRRFPLHPDDEPDPKRTLVNLARYSRRTAIRQDIVPREASGAPVGPGYVSRILAYLGDREAGWHPEEAQARSESLRRCLTALARVAQQPISWL